jgi:deoxyribonuclease-4
VSKITTTPRQYPAAKTALQFGRLLTKNNNQWRAKPLSNDDAARFRDALERTGIQKPCAHDSYLINLASPKDDLWQKSLDAFVIELQRAEALGLVGVVMHPGSYVESTEEQGLNRIVRAIDLALEQTDGFQTEIWLETTAGQGTNLGWKFEHLQFIISEVAENHRLGVCVDTCHIFAAGYPIQSIADYQSTMKTFDDTIGIDRIRAFHLNDSKRELGSRVDRHEHIGEGCLGREPFRHVLNDSRFANIPMYLETKNGERDDGKPWDAVNLSKLRRLLKSGRSAKGC